MKARFLILAVLVLSVLAIDAHSAPPQPAAAKKGSPKTVKVTFVNASWREVFQWLFEQTGKPVQSCTPNGRFTLVGPADKEYTIAEVLACINEAFAHQPPQFLLIEHERSFSLLNRDCIVGGQ